MRTAAVWSARSVAAGGGAGGSGADRTGAGAGVATGVVTGVVTGVAAGGGAGVAANDGDCGAGGRLALVTVAAAGGGAATGTEAVRWRSFFGSTRACFAVVPPGREICAARPPIAGAGVRSRGTDNGRAARGDVAGA